jgi:hypothetical protein
MDGGGWGSYNVPAAGPPPDHGMWPHPDYFERAPDFVLEPVGMWDDASFENPALLAWMQHLPLDILEQIAIRVFRGDDGVFDIHDGGLFSNHTFDVDTSVLTLTFGCTELEESFWYKPRLVRHYWLVRWFQHHAGVPARFVIQYDAFQVVGNDEYSTQRCDLDAICGRFWPSEVTMTVASPSDDSDEWVWAWYIKLCESYSSHISIEPQWPCQYRLRWV